tara:strand:- start:377 stop:646 length:270 start_codon:yes stop_codon:yes gene_type:complete
MKTNKTYVFNVPCAYVYKIEAKSEEQAKKILREKGEEVHIGFRSLSDCDCDPLDIDGDFVVGENNYEKADCIDEYDSDRPTPKLISIRW